MTQHIWFSAGGEHVREALEAAFAWCEQCSIVTDAPTVSEQGDALWSQVDRHADQVRAAILSNLEAADPGMLRALHNSGRIRRFTDDTPHSHFIWFARGDEIRFALAPGALHAGTIAGPGLWFFCEGPSSTLPDGLPRIFDDCWSSSVPVGPSDWEPKAPIARTIPGYSRPIPSVREVLGMRSTTDFFDLDTEAQERALWSALIGEGTVDLEQAIRLCAGRLRSQGFLEYQVLRQDGRVHGGIGERLLAARRSTELFDRPRNGFVRAIQSDLDQLTAEQWRDCLMGALEERARVDRDQAVRLGFAYAQATYGIKAQRLRVGGRADQALRSAINSAVRQEYLERDGAAYLVRVAPSVAPTLRGVLTPEGTEEPASVGTPATTTLVESAAIEHAPSERASDAVPSGETVPDRVVADAPAAPQTSPPGGSSPLDRKLRALDFPTRALNWADRQRVHTIRELIAWQPDDFANERNVGRRTVRETRELIQALLGYSWEEARAAIRGGTEPPGPSHAAAANEQIDTATEALTAGGSTGWEQLVEALTDDDRAISLLDVQLPTRMKTFVRAAGFKLVGDLFRLSYSTLIGEENLGQKSLNDTLDAVRDCLSERASPPAYATFLQAWQAQLSALEPIPRMIVTRRAGMHGTRETLEELGGMLGVTRERVRQIETRVVERLGERSRWRRSVESNVAAAFGAARAVPLALLAEEPWWAGIDRQELLLDYVVRRIFEDELFQLEAPSGKHYLTKFAPSEFVEHLENAKNRIAKLEYPVEMSAIHEILHSEADPLDPIIFAEFEQAVGELLHLDEGKPTLALGYGRYRYDEVLAFLSGQTEPVPIAVLEERCGRGQLPDEVLYFKRGVVGLKRHFPDFDTWTDRLVPAALDVMKERPAGRQWLVPEIHDVLRERGVIPDWLGHWHLASLLRLSGQVVYLGRLRVASKEGGQEQRLQYEELLERLIEEAGAPLEFHELLARVRVQTDMGEGTASLMVLQAPFVRLDEHRIGLVERDIPGGPKAVAAAIEIIIHTLAETQRGLTPHQATRLVNSLSDTHASWTKQLVVSVLRNEITIRIDRTKNIGLDAWDDVRCPTRPEFVRLEVQKAGGPLRVSELTARMDSFYGRAPDRGSLGVMVEQVGLTLQGDEVSRPGGAASEAPVSRANINLAGIPTELREMFEGLVKQPLSDVLELRTQIQAHVDAIANEHHVNEFVDLPGAHVLARQSHLLLDRWESLPIPDRHLANAAVCYFVSWDDVENDFDIGGLDDDKQIMNAVLSHLGLQEGGDGAPPS